MQRRVHDRRAVFLIQAPSEVVAAQADDRHVERSDSPLLHVVLLLWAKAILHEVVSVLGRKFARDTEELARVAVFLAEIGHVVNPIRTITLLDDEGDNRILECAVTAEVESIVTGDREMLLSRQL
ncbi:MAG: PIN domain-containing protein [Gemmatimonadetes bacterium]|nr:PIN domain-containing protein [Gemmatimonadota bacterium]